MGAELDLWVAGEFKDAPLDEAGAAAIAVSEQHIDYP